MKKVEITKEIFDRIIERTCNNWDGESGISSPLRLHFSGKQKIDFLEKNGFIVTLHTALGTVDVYQGDYSPSKKIITPIERIVAVINLDELPEKWEYNSYGGFIFDDYDVVFNRLIKDKLLNL